MKRSAQVHLPGGFIILDDTIFPVVKGKVFCIVGFGGET
jgi:hypothetical protein